MNEKGIADPAEILNQLKINVMNFLHKTGKPGESTDVLDISIVVIDKKKEVVEYASAMNSIYLIRDNNLVEYFADKMPIGMYEIINKSFTKQQIKYQVGDQFYLFTDGFADQFGGKKNRKLMYHNFKKLLLENQNVLCLLKKKL